MPEEPYYIKQQRQDAENKKRIEAENEQMRRDNEAKRQQQRQREYEQARDRTERERERERQKARERANGQGCFTAETPILTPNGWRAISSFKEGEEIISFDEKDGSTSVRRIFKLVEHKPSTIWEINFLQSDRSIRSTKIHSFLTNRGWLRTNQLKEGDVLSTFDNQEAIVSAVCKTDKVETVFNLITQGEHTFIVQGCVAHNYTYFRNLRMWLSNLASNKGKAQSLVEA